MLESDLDNTASRLVIHPPILTLQLLKILNHLQDPEQRMKMEDVMRHPWVTNQGRYVLKYV